MILLMIDSSLSINLAVEEIFIHHDANILDISWEWIKIKLIDIVSYMLFIDVYEVCYKLKSTEAVRML
jgi:hypothetical protein